MKHLIKFFKKIVWRNKYMKTLNVEKVIKSDTKTEDWELLCDTCASLAEKANWTEQDSDKLIKHIRKETREQ